VEAIGMAETARRAAEEERTTEREAPAAATESMLVFRAGSPDPKAVALSLVTRLEEIDARTIEMSSGRPLVQYRGQLMPVVPANHEVRVRTSGRQPVLVFSDDERSMGLAVDEIVDIVEDRLDIELASERPGLIGSAVIKGQATEVIDIAHFLPLAFDDWCSWRERGARKGARTPPRGHARPLFLELLSPAVSARAWGADALAVMEGGGRFDVVITDIEMPGMDGFEFASALRGNPRTAELPIIGLSSLVSAEAIERGKRVGLHDYVAKFDRQGLIAALKEQTADMVPNVSRAA